MKLKAAHADSEKEISMIQTFKTCMKAGALSLAAIAILGGPATRSAAWAQQTFPTPEAASAALIDLAKAGSPGFVDRIFGKGAAATLGTGDPDEDLKQVKRFSDAAAEANSLVTRDENTRLLQVGRNAYLFPVPIVKSGSGWAFDLEAGRIELENRRIGLNELSAIEACETYVAAQREYFKIDRDNDGVQQYASRFMSSPGRHDGLYWPPENQADRSPLDGRISASVLKGSRSEPYNGYSIRILTGQGAAAPGGAYSYLINGRLLIGFALVAYPADWGHTGVMSFMCNQSGRVFQKNLGPRTAEVAGTMTRYNPDPSWSQMD